MNDADKTKRIIAMMTDEKPPLPPSRRPAMTADVELLPLPDTYSAAEVAMRNDGRWVRREDFDWHIRQDRARATAAKDAEIEALRAEVERLRGLVVSRFDQDGPPTFRQGTPENELEDPVTAEHCAWFVAEIKRLRAEVERLHEQLRLATVDQAIAEAEASDAHAENKRLQEAFVAQQPEARVGEEIMVNAAHGVFTLPLQPSGLNGPRFVVHVPGPEQQPAGGVHDIAARLVDELDVLVGESDGVSGLHLNGDVATWDELLPGGRFERLSSLDELRAALAAQQQEPTT